MEENLLERAIRLAVKVHKGQKDRAGKPYILHVLRVMMATAALEREVCVAPFMLTCPSRRSRAR